MCKVTINIESVFNGVNDMKELKEMAQSCINQISAAYKKRLTALEAIAKKPSDVDITTESEPKTKARKTVKKTSEKAANTTTKKTAEKAEKEVVEQIAISSLTKAQIKAMGLKFEKYSDKCMFLTGNTRSIKDEIKSMNGATWNGHRQGRFVKNDTAKELAKALKIKIA